jgi:DNA-binding transcriptional regulator YiaG
MSDADTMKKTGKHDWSRFDALTDEEVRAAALADPDAQPLTEERLARMKRVPQARTLRRALSLTQEEFAARYHIPIGTLRDWEQGRSEPDQPARAYLNVIAHDPDGVRRGLEAGQPHRTITRTFLPRGRENLYDRAMTKRITDSQILGELGESAIKKLVLEMRLIYDPRGRLEAGTDGIIELRDPKSGAPLGKLLGVQVKATESGHYIRETDRSFEYLLKPDDLKYWRGSNIPVIIVLWRQSDESAYWKNVTDCVKGEERRLEFDKSTDMFDVRCADRIGALTIDRRAPGVFLPPLNQGEEAIINLLRIKLPDEIFFASSPFGSGRDAIPELVKHDDTRFDWVIRKRRFASFFDPRDYATRAIVDLDQVDAVDTKLFAFNDDLDDTNDVIDLLRRTVERQTSEQLSYLRKERLFHFRATDINKSRSYKYVANVDETSARVVSAYANKKDPKGQGYVRHHAASFRFERLADEWFLIVDPTFYFTKDGFQPHRFPEALLAGKKRLERNAAVRGQVMMWQHLLVESGKSGAGLFDTDRPEPIMSFATLPLIQLSQAVPEASWTRTDPRAKEMESRDLFEEEIAA